MSTLQFAGKSLNEVKAYNVEAILKHLLYEKRISRAGLAQRTALSSATVTNLINELMESGIVTESSPTDLNQNQKRNVGRPRRMLRLIPNARYAIGVHIGIGLFRVAVTNLYAEILANRIVKYDLSLPSEQVLAQIVSNIELLIQEAGIDRERVLGVGVGASGLVDHARGVNLHAPRLGWENVEIQKRLESSLNLPVHVDNNVRCMAIGEAYFGAGRDVNVLAFVYGRIGVGAGFVVNGRVYRGSGEGAGEIGHTVIIPDGGQLCQCGKKGCLETVVSEQVLVDEAVQLAKSAPNSILAAHLNAGEPKPSVEQVFAAARDGDQLTKKMIEEHIYYLGVALGNLVNILNPDKILLGGMFAQGDDLIRPVATRVMQQTAFCGMGDRVSIEPTSFGWRAGVIGAASLALMDFFYMRSEVESW